MLENAQPDLGPKMENTRPDFDNGLIGIHMS
jgi:hypothetical protein